MSLSQRNPGIAPYEILTFECFDCGNVKCVTYPPGSRRARKQLRVEERIAETEFLMVRQQMVISSGHAEDVPKAVELVQMLQAILATLLQERNIYDRRRVADEIAVSCSAALKRRDRYG